MKILVIGHDKAGKSTVAKELANSLATNFINESDIIVSDYAALHGVTVDHILRNKDQYRKDLFAYGKMQQSDNPSYPGLDAVANYDIVTGTRTRNEFNAIKNAFDLIVWVFRDNYDSGCELSPSDADIAIYNDGDIEDLIKSVKLLAGGLDERRS